MLEKFKDPRFVHCPYCKVRVKTASMAKRSPLIRDVAQAVSQFLEDDRVSPITDDVLLRGPLLEKMTYEQLGCPGTIINLRLESDDISHLHTPNVIQLLHCPMGNKSNVYETQLPAVRTWLADVFRHLEAPVDFPILVHCKHGRDRTGVVVAVLLMILGVPKEAIKQEFLLTEDAEAVDLKKTFDGIVKRGGIDKYFEGMLDLEAIRGHLSFSHIQQNRRLFFKESAQALKDKTDPSFSCESLLEACRCGLRLKPDDVEMHAGVGWALVHLDRRDEACQAFSEGLRLAASCNVRPEIVKMMNHEIKALEATASKHIPSGTHENGSVVAG